MPARRVGIAAGRDYGADMGVWRNWQRPEVILFDMDGTLTRPALNFEHIRRDMGIAQGQPILEAMAQMDTASLAHAEAVLLKHERDAAASAELNEGCHDVLELLRVAGVKTGLVTRNSMESTRTVLGAHGLDFASVVTREDEPYKPRPEPLFLALHRLGVSCSRERVWMVGDGEHDIQAGLAAGVRTVWLSHGGERRFDALPCLEVRDLVELHGVFREALAGVSD